MPVNTIVAGPRGVDGIMERSIFNQAPALEVARLMLVYGLDFRDIPHHPRAIGFRASGLGEDFVTLIWELERCLGVTFETEMETEEKTTDTVVH